MWTSKFRSVDSIPTRAIAAAVKRPAIRSYYDERYGSQSLDAFPEDPARHRVWLSGLLSDVEAGDTVLDFGCGVGYVCSQFATLDGDVTGIDISPIAVDIARQREPRATFVEARTDAALPFAADTFDIVTCLGVLEHIPDPAPIVAELRRVAKPGAHSVWVVPNARSPFFWFGHGTGQVEEHPRTLSEWRDLLVDGGWQVERVRRDPGPIDRPIAAWKRLAQSLLNLLPLGFTYQFVIDARAGG